MQKNCAQQPKRPVREPKLFKKAYDSSWNRYETYSWPRIFFRSPVCKAGVVEKERGYRIAFVCDFFYPRLGGVEMHIWSLSQHLIRQGHKVILITHAYGNRTGVRYMGPPSSLLKVYYCPILSMTDDDSMPTFTATFPILRHILIRENIEIVHAHQATSVLANESIAYGGALRLATVYTDHSLFGFNDVASVILNRVSSSWFLG